MSVWKYIDPDTGEVKKVGYASGGGGASGGVASFNGRTGAVVPASGDYTAEMVGASTIKYITSTITVPASGYGFVELNDKTGYKAIKDKNKVISVKCSTGSIAGSYGLQITVGATDSDGVYLWYYRPVAAAAAQTITVYIYYYE